MKQALIVSSLAIVASARATQTEAANLLAQASEDLQRGVWSGDIRGPLFWVLSGLIKLNKKREDALARVIESPMFDLVERIAKAAQAHIDAGTLQAEEAVAVAFEEVMSVIDRDDGAEQPAQHVEQPADVAQAETSEQTGA